MATALASTITIVKGKKVVSTSKHFVGLYKEAKTAYLEKKAELKTAREDEFQQRLLALKESDQQFYSQQNTPINSRDVSRDSSRNRNRGSPVGYERRTVERGYSDSFFAPDDTRGQGGNSPGSYANYPPRYSQSELIQRHSSSDAARTAALTQTATGRMVPDDAGFAYNVVPPPLPTRRPEDELRSKMTTLNRMLEEANCVQHSAKAIIKSLESNPDAMAAVALTLAEISNLARKMAPGTLMTFKGSFPAIIALLASSEFLIAVGVGVGLTVVAFGGYKIIKRIQAKKVANGELQTDELEDVTGDLESVEAWQRGISEEDAQSIETSVEGEFITPRASQQLRDQGLHPKGGPKTNRFGRRSNKAIEAPSNSIVDNDLKTNQVQAKDKESSALRMLFKRKENSVA